MSRPSSRFVPDLAPGEYFQQRWRDGYRQHVRRMPRGKVRRRLFHLLNTATELYLQKDPEYPNISTTEERLDRMYPPRHYDRIVGNSGPLQVGA